MYYCHVILIGLVVGCLFYARHVIRVKRVKTLIAELVDVRRAKERHLLLHHVLASGLFRGEPLGNKYSSMTWERFFEQYYYILLNFRAPWRNQVIPTCEIENVHSQIQQAAIRYILAGGLFNRDLTRKLETCRTDYFKKCEYNDHFLYQLGQVINWCRGYCTTRDVDDNYLRDFRIRAQQVADKKTAVWLIATVNQLHQHLGASLSCNQIIPVLVYIRQRLKGNAMTSDTRMRIDVSAMYEPIADKLVTHFSTTPPPNLRERLIRAGNTEIMVDRLLHDNDFCWMCIATNSYFLWYKDLPFMFVEPEIHNDDDNFHFDGLTLFSQSLARDHHHYQHLVVPETSSAFDLKLYVDKQIWTPKQTYSKWYSDAIVYQHINRGDKACPST